MPVYRQFPKSDTRQIVDYNRVLTMTGDKVFVCLDRGAIQIILNFLSTRAKWPTTYVISYDQGGYYIPDVNEMQPILDIIGEAINDMASCDDIVTALEGIKTAIETTQPQASSGCGCVGDGSTDVTDVFDEEPTDLPPTNEDPPSTFATWDEYNTYKCAAATWWLDQYQGTFRNWGGLSGLIGGLTLAVISGLLLLSVPPVGLMVIMAALGTIVGFNIGFLVHLVNVADLITDNLDDFLCDIYSSQSTDEAIGKVETRIHGLIDEQEWVSLITDNAKIIATNLMSNENMSAVFERSSLVPEDATGDCSSCDPALPIVYPFNVDTDGFEASIVAGTSSEVQFPTVSAQLRMRLVNDGTAEQKIGRYTLTFDPGDYLVLPACTMSWIGRMTQTGCANGNTFGVTYSDDTQEYTNVSPYTYNDPTVNETLTLAITGGSVKEVWWQFDQALGCLSAGNYICICTEIRFDAT